MRPHTTKYDFCNQMRTKRRNSTKGDHIRPKRLLRPKQHKRRNSTKSEQMQPNKTTATSSDLLRPKRSNATKCDQIYPSWQHLSDLTKIIRVDKNYPSWKIIRFDKNYPFWRELSELTKIIRFENFIRFDEINRTGTNISYVFCQLP